MPGGVTGTAREGLPMSILARGVMANQVDFYYEGGKAGRIDVSCFPNTSGEVTYEPYRSSSHHAMGMAINDSAQVMREKARSNSKKSCDLSDR